MKAVTFLGGALSALRAFPATARRRAGYQLDRIQRGLDPDDWKPMATIGAGVREIRIRDEAGAFRVLYLATLSDAVYVLHCFQKKSQRTDRSDVELGRKRYRELMRDAP
jgi:phage-related protein